MCNLHENNDKISGSFGEKFGNQNQQQPLEGNTTETSNRTDRINRTDWPNRTDKTDRTDRKDMIAIKT